MTRYTHRFKVGDTVNVVVPDPSFTDDAYDPTQPLALAVVIEQHMTGFCTTCHCIPQDPDHAGDGSLCCPGPFYLVHADGHDLHFAEHEIEPSLHAA